MFSPYMQAVLRSFAAIVFNCSAVTFKPTIILTITLIVSSNVLGQGTRTGTTDGYTPPDFAAGTTPSSYPLSDFDQINMFSRKANFFFPLVSLPGRGKVPTNIGMRGDSYWEVRTVDADHLSATYAPGFYGIYNPGSVSIDGREDPQYSEITCGGPQRYPQWYAPRIRVKLSDGAETDFYSVANNGAIVYTDDLCKSPRTFNFGKVFVSSDSESMTFVLDSDYGGTYTGGTLITRDGTRYRFNEYGFLVLVKDTNGNFISYTYDTTSPYQLWGGLSDP